VKPHIVILFEFSTLSGGELSMLGALERIDRFQFTAFAPAAGSLADALRQRKIPVVDFTLHSPRGNLSRNDARAVLGALIDLHQPKIIHANSLSMSRLLGSCRDIGEIPRTGHLRDILKLSNKAIAHLNQCDRLIAVSQATADFHIAQGVEAERVTVIHNGVDLDRFQVRDSNSLRTELGLAPSARLIGTIGQICLRKGHDLIPQVASRLPCRENQIHFVIVGKRYSTKQESIDFDRAIDAGFEELGLSSHLHRLGFRRDVPRLLNEFDLLFHPARQEPLGRVLLEAAASGCPIVATNVGGTPEIVEHKRSALLFPVDDAEAASGYIQRILDDEESGRSLTTAARERMEQAFSIEVAAERLAGLWEGRLHR
jgi:glycosyltransferase involved in cell wall biosynthesis